MASSTCQCSVGPFGRGYSSTVLHEKNRTAPVEVEAQSAVRQRDFPQVVFDLLKVATQCRHRWVLLMLVLMAYRTATGFTCRLE